MGGGSAPGKGSRTGALEADWIWNQSLGVGKESDPDFTVWGGTRGDKNPKGLEPVRGLEVGGIWSQEKIWSQEGIWKRSSRTRRELEPELGHYGRSRAQISELGGGRGTGFDSGMDLEPGKDLEVQF